MSTTWARRVSGFFTADSPLVPNLGTLARMARNDHLELSHRLSRCLRPARAALAIDEIQVPSIDEHAESLAEDEHRIADGERIEEQEQAAADREEPERDRKHALPRPLGRDPLHHEAHGEQR